VLARTALDPGLRALRLHAPRRVPPRLSPVQLPASERETHGLRVPLRQLGDLLHGQVGHDATRFSSKRESSFAVGNASTRRAMNAFDGAVFPVITR
jgi:hypothetical protein